MNSTIETNTDGTVNLFVTDDKEMHLNAYHISMDQAWKIIAALNEKKVVYYEQPLS